MAEIRTSAYKIRCPRCNFQHETTAHITPTGDRDEPHDGDIGICGHCAAPFMLDVERGPRWLTYSELEDFLSRVPPIVTLLLTMRVFHVLTNRDCKPVPTA